jgi:hypothetical protein
VRDQLTALASAEPAALQQPVRILYSDEFHRWGVAMVDAARQRFKLAPEQIVYLAEKPERDASRIHGISTREQVERALAEQVFRPCGSREEWWSWSGQSIIEADPRGWGRVFVVVEGQVSPRGSYGHLGRYPRQIIITSVLEVRSADRTACRSARHFPAAVSSPAAVAPRRARQSVPAQRRGG